MKGDDRLYPILVPNWFQGGWVGDRAQVLIDEDADRLMCVWFHADGRLDRVEEVPLAGRPDDSDARQQWAQAAIDEWMRARHVTPGLLKVRRFGVHRPWLLSIGRYPRHLQEFLEEPGAWEPDERAEMEADVRGWDEDGGFVIYRDMSEYWLNHTGRVKST